MIGYCDETIISVRIVCCFWIYVYVLSCDKTLKDKYPNFEVGFKCILKVNPY